jgi:hypothetical protein
VEVGSVAWRDSVDSVDSVELETVVVENNDEDSSDCDNDPVEDKESDEDEDEDDDEDDGRNDDGEINKGDEDDDDVDVLGPLCDEDVSVGCFTLKSSFCACACNALSSLRFSACDAFVCE